jgi:dTDP-4-dehydrorhamnose reductase
MSHKILYTNLDSMRILITGKNGQVGTELSRRYESHGDVVLTGRDECDLSSEASIREAVRRVKPTVIINAGAPLFCHQCHRSPGAGRGSSPAGRSAHPLLH